MITATGLSKNYGSQELFSDTNLQLNKGYRYGIVGANGSGKSTLVDLIMGLIEPTSGSIYINEKPLSQIRENW